MNEDDTETAATRIQILVGAPGCEIDIPIVQLHRNISSRVRKVPSDYATLAGEKVLKLQ